MPVVEFFEPFSLHRQARYNPGERATVTDVEAREVVRQKAGFVVQDIAGYDYARKNYDAPPAHKQIKGAPVAK